MMTVLYGIGMILRFILKIALLPVQAALTLLMLAIGFIGGFANIACGLIGSFFVIGGILPSFVLLNITLRRSRLSGVARATFPDKQSHLVINYCIMF